MKRTTSHKMNKITYWTMNGILGVLNFERGHRKRKEGATGRAINDGDIVDEPVDVLAVVVVLHEVTPAKNTK